MCLKGSSESWKRRTKIHIQFLTCKRYKINRKPRWLSTVLLPTIDIWNPNVTRCAKLLPTDTIAIWGGFKPDWLILQQITGGGGWEGAPSPAETPPASNRCQRPSRSRRKRGASLLKHGATTPYPYTSPSHDHHTPTMCMSLVWFTYPLIPSRCFNNPRL